MSSTTRPATTSPSTSTPARRRRDLSVDEIVDRAIEILRDGGEAALSMRRVADACGVTPMAIYHHVGNKEELLNLTVDRVVGAILPGDELGVAWRTRLIEFGCRFRQALLDHPGVGAMFVRRPIIGPNFARTTELIFETLARGGITGGAAAEAADAFVLVTLGSVANDLSRPPDVRERLLGQVPDAETPRMIEQIDAYAHRDGETRYRRALEWMLDGVERSAVRAARN